MHKPLAVLAVGLCGLMGTTCQKGSDDLSVFQADLSPANEVPARSSAARGAAGFTFDGTSVSYSLEVHDISSVTASHIHTGAAGVNGPVRVFLFGGPVTATVDGILAQGSFTAADVTGVSFEQLLDAMRSGNAYVNVHTTTYPAGEIRGQVRLLK